MTETQTNLLDRERELEDIVTQIEQHLEEARSAFDSLNYLSEFGGEVLESKERRKAYESKHDIEGIVYRLEDELEEKEEELAEVRSEIDR